MSETGVRVEGMDACMKAMTREIRRLPRVTLKGLIAAGLFVQGEAQKRAPIQYGNLRASAFTTWSRGGASAPPANDPSFVDPGHGEDAQLKADHSAVVSKAQEDCGSLMIDDPAVETGFSAFYALYVHENLSASHFKETKKGEFKSIGEAKFLENAFWGNMQKILGIIKRVSASSFGGTK